MIPRYIDEHWFDFEVPFDEETALNILEKEHHNCISEIENRNQPNDVAQQTSDNEEDDDDDDEDNYGDDDDDGDVDDDDDNDDDDEFEEDDAAFNNVAYNSEF